MARGSLYEISTTTNSLYSTKVSDIELIMDNIGIDHVSDDLSADYTKNVFKNYLKKYGAILTENDGIIFTKDFKLNYFKEKYKKFVKLSNKISLDDFATSWLSELQQIIEDKYDDIVFDPEEKIWYTLDSFIRQADENIPYYIGNVMIIK